MNKFKAKHLLMLSLVVAVIASAVIPVFDSMFINVKLGPDQGPWWYLWKLPKQEWYTKYTYWVPYILQQLLNIYFISKIRKVKKTLSDDLTKYNWYLFITNTVFIIIHFIQTALFYDGTAADTPIWTSQGSVIIMLAIILILFNSTRGFIFGIKLKWMMSKWVHVTHGILFSIAILYTFWFHPIVNTQGHILGFIYIYLLMAGINIAKTKLHNNKYWVVCLELFVTLHAVIVAISLQNSPIWPMFLFGFLTMFFTTQIYVLDVKRSVITGLQTLYLLIVFLFYSKLLFGQFDINSLKNIHQITWIPVIEYGFAMLIAFIPWSIGKLFKKN